MYKMHKDSTPQTPPKANVDLTDLIFEFAFAKACGLQKGIKPRYSKKYYRVNFDTIDQQTLANIHLFLDTYKPAELNMRRSGTGIVVLTCK